MTKRVVVTGMAITSPLGSSLNSVYERLHKLENCVQYDESLDIYKGLHTRLSTKVQGFVQPEDFTRKVTRSMGNVAIMSVTTAKQALEDAALLAFLGETDGVSRLEREIEKTPWDEGWNYRGMGQFGASMSPLDTLLFALSTVADSPVYEKKLRDLKPDHAFSHFRAVCRALMRHPHKECAGMLETLLRTPGMAGWAQKNLADTVRANRAEVDDTTVRNSQLKELYLAKALAACDPSNPFAASILKDYADGLQGVYAIFAR